MIITRCQRTVLSLILALIAAAGRTAAADAAPAKAGETVRVMTFNVRVAVDRTPNSWPERRPLIREMMDKTAPDLFGTQEGLYQQVKDLATDLPEFDWIGLGRDGGSRGEFMAVFYRKNRFEPVQFDHFWLSDTPNVVGSTTWGNTNRRMVTWVRFRDRASNQEFYFVNTHLDHQIQPAREKAASLIRERVDALRTELPVILLGDFNAAAGANKAYDILVTEGGFTDGWLTAKERRGKVVKTFNGFSAPVEGDERIDWILARGPVAFEAIEIVTHSRDGRNPSDHFPVVAWVRLGKTP